MNFTTETPNPPSMLSFEGTIQRGFTKIVHSASFAGLLSAESGVQSLIEVSLDTAFQQLFAKAWTKLSSTRWGHFANLISETKVRFKIALTSGELQFAVEGGLLEGVTLGELPRALKTITVRFPREMVAALHQHNAEHGLSWDNSRKCYVQRGSEDAAYDPIGAILNQLGLPFLAVRLEYLGQFAPEEEVPKGSYRCRHCSGIHSIAEQVERLQMLREEMGGHLVTRDRVASFFPPEVLKALEESDAQNAPWGKYPCHECLGFHSLGANEYWDVANREVRQIPRGKYPTPDGGLAEIPDGQFWNPNARILEEIPQGTYVEDGEIKYLPHGTAYDYTRSLLYATTPGQFYDLEFGAVSDIPEGMFVDQDGDLDDLPDGTIFDYKLNGFRAKERGKYWDVEAEELRDIPEDHYLNADGAVVPLPPDTTFDYDKDRLVSTLAGHYFNIQTYQVEPIPEGQYVTATGELDTLPDGLYPDAGGNLQEIPTGQRWNTAAGSLEPAPETAAE